MHPLIGEFIGTALLILLGNGVVANCLLDKSKGQGGGWIVITFGWAMAVFVGVFVAAPHSGAHLNPAVSLGLATIGKFAWAQVPAYVLAQILGAMLGSTLVWLAYKKHYDASHDAGLLAATFCTAPAIRDKPYNFLTELIGTFVLVFGVLYIVSPADSLGALDALPVAFLVLALGLSLGGPTGYAINPARDFGPRLLLALLPIPHKGANDWSYAWVPILGPIAGALLAALGYLLLS